MKVIKEVIVVEGKTDTAIIKKLFKADTIETHGLALSKETLDYIEEIAKTRGVIVLTDPDFPGKKIRDQIQQRVKNAKHAFVSKEDARGKKKLGVAEAKEEAIIRSLENMLTFSEENDSITWEEFVSLDIIGDKEKRMKIYDYFHLGYGNVKTLYKRLNMAGINKEEVLYALSELYQ